MNPMKYYYAKVIKLLLLFCRPLYTPLSSIVLQDDDEFCQKYGFTTEEDYDNFLRTLWNQFSFCT